MEIQTIGAWGELLGGISGVVAALGVFATLLYLARQVQQNTVQMRAQIAHDVMSELRAQFEPLKHSEGAELYIRGLVGMDNLSDVEQMQFRNINAGYFRVFEEAYLHHKAGRFEDAYWNSLSGQLEIVLKIRGIREDWAHLEDNFDRDFIDYGNSLRGNSNS